MTSRLTRMVGIAMIAGPLCGLALHHWLGNGEAATRVAADLSLVTTAFLRLIKMIIAPLVFSTLTAGVARMESAASTSSFDSNTVTSRHPCSTSATTAGIR